MDLRRHTVLEILFLMFTIVYCGSIGPWIDQACLVENMDSETSFKYNHFTSRPLINMYIQEHKSSYKFWPDFSHRVTIYTNEERTKWNYIYYHFGVRQIKYKVNDTEEWRRGFLDRLINKNNLTIPSIPNTTQYQTGENALVFVNGKKQLYHNNYAFWLTKKARVIIHYYKRRLLYYNPQYYYCFVEFSIVNLRYKSYQDIRLDLGGPDGWKIQVTKITAQAAEPLRFIMRSDIPSEYMMVAIDCWRYTEYEDYDARCPCYGNATERKKNWWLTGRRIYQLIFPEWYIMAAAAGLVGLFYVLHNYLKQRKKLERNRRLKLYRRMAAKGCGITTCSYKTQTSEHAYPTPYGDKLRTLRNAKKRFVLGNPPKVKAGKWATYKSSLTKRKNLIINPKVINHIDTGESHPNENSTVPSPSPAYKTKRRRYNNPRRYFLYVPMHFGRHHMLRKAGSQSTPKKSPLDCIPGPSSDIEPLQIIIMDLKS